MIVKRKPMTVLVNRKTELGSGAQELDELMSRENGFEGRQVYNDNRKLNIHSVHQTLQGPPDA